MAVQLLFGCARPSRLVFISSVVTASWASLCWGLRERSVSRCSYRTEPNKEFPYPYDSQDWAEFLVRSSTRDPPSWLLGSLASEGKHDTVALAKRIFEREFLLPDDIRQAAQSHAGDLSRLRLVLTKLINGEPITVVVLGGSIMCGGDVYEPRRLTDGFAGQLFAWINDTFPHPGHRQHNGCVPGAGSAFVSVCLKSRIPYDDVDLVIMEFDLNDYNPGWCCADEFLNNPWRRGLEVLMRRLLLLPSRPAVTYLHVWIPEFFQYSFYNVTVEDQVELFVKYYGLQSVSFRDAIFPLYAANVPGFRDSDFVCNAMHPNYLGHRYLADMYISFLQDQLAPLLLAPATALDRKRAERDLHIPLLPDNFEYKTVCMEEAGLKAGFLQSQSSQHCGLCGSKRPSRVRKVVRTQVLQGWVWKDEPTRYGAHKMGYVTTTAGATLVLKVNSTNPHSRQDGPVNTTLALGILQSYRRMGMGSIRCVSGCVCYPASTIFNSHWDQHTSLQKWVYFGVSESPDCIIEITNLQQTTSGEHKLKVQSLGVLPFSPEDSKLYSMWVDDGFMHKREDSPLPHTAYSAK